MAAAVDIKGITVDGRSNGQEELITAFSGVLVCCNGGDGAESTARVQHTRNASRRMVYDRQTMLALAESTRNIPPSSQLRQQLSVIFNSTSAESRANSLHFYGSQPARDYRPTSSRGRGAFADRRFQQNRSRDVLLERSQYGRLQEAGGDFCRNDQSTYGKGLQNEQNFDWSDEPMSEPARQIRSRDGLAQRPAYDTIIHKTMTFSNLNFVKRDNDVSPFDRFSVRSGSRSGSESESGRSSPALSSDFQLQSIGSMECGYCGQPNMDNLVKCVDKGCHKWFCNGCTDTGFSQKESHIITHLRAAKHHQIGVNSFVEQHTVVDGRPVSSYEPTLTTFRCAGPDCSECDAFDLGMEFGNDGRNPATHFCGSCAIKMKKITSQRRPFINSHHPDLTCINEAIAKVPSNQDQRHCRKISQRAVAELERSWLIAASGISMPGKGRRCGLRMKATFSSSEEYVQHFTSLVNLDLSLAGMESATIPVLENVKITNRDTGYASQWFEFETRSQIHKRVFQYGQPVLVHIERAKLNVEKPKASIKFNSDRSNVCHVRVQFSPQSGNVSLEGIDTVGVEVEFQDVVYKRQLEALDRFCFVEPMLQKFILGTRESGGLTLSDEPVSGRRLCDVPGRTLNPSQEAAVRLALSSPFSLIQGPPGTGKTHTIVAIAANLLAQGRAARILCCAPSNDPTDHLAVQMSRSGIEVLRIHSGRVETDALPKELRELTLRFRLESLLGKDYERKHSSVVDSETEHIVNSVQVICTTCSTSIARAVVNWPSRLINYNILIIDEATQATEADALIPITKGFDKVIMIGDHKQLGVVNRFRELEKTNLGCSLFERLISLHQAPSVLLNEQYRMHPQICAAASEVMYERRLMTGVDVRALRESTGDSLEFLHGTGHFSPLVMVDIATLHEMASDRVSTVNLHEAMVVTLCLVNLLHRDVSPEDVGVITFYNGQKEFLKRTIASHSCIPKGILKRLMIDSVDAFQGREKDYIILSCVRSGNVESTSIGFLQNERRLNVALTRAKKGVLAVGNRTLLETTSDNWRVFLKDYLHVGEKDAFDRLGASHGENRSCPYCDHPEKRNTCLLQPTDAEIPGLITELVHSTEIPCNEGDDSAIEGVYQKVARDLANFSREQKFDIVTCLVDTYYSGSLKQRKTIPVLLRAAIVKGVLPLDMLEESLGQQAALTNSVSPWYPGMLVELIAPLVTDGYVSVDQLDGVFKKSGQRVVVSSGNRYNEVVYQEAFQTWLRAADLVPEKRQDLMAQIESLDWIIL